MRTLLAKEFLRRLRSPVSTVGVLAFPFLMALMIGGVSGGGGGGSSFPRVHVLVWDQDQSWLSQQLIGMLGSEQMTEYVRVETVGDEGHARMLDGDASALVIIPAGFGDAVVNADSTTIQLQRNPAESIKPEIVEGALQLLCTYLDLAGKVFGEELAELAALLESDGFPGVPAIVAVSEKIATRIGELERYVFPPVIQVASVKESEAADDDPGFNLFGIVLAMVSVMSMLFASSRAVLDLFEEERTGMVRRMLSAPITPGLLIASKMVFAVLFGVLVEVLLLTAGLILGWFSFGPHLLGAIVVAAAFSFGAAGLLSTVYAVARTEKQAALLNFILIMGMSVLGGSMVPVDNFPAALQKVSHFTLNYWAIQGLISQLFRGESILATWPSLAALCGAGVVLMSIGMASAQRRLTAVMT